MIIPSLQVNPIRKSPRSILSDVVGTVENFAHKAADCPNKKTTKIRAQKENPSIKRNRVLMETTKEKEMLKIKCLNCSEYGHYAHDCLKSCDNANIAQERE